MSRIFSYFLLALIAAASIPAYAQPVTERGFAEGTGFGFASKAPNDSTELVGDALIRDEVFIKPAPWLQLAGGMDLRANSHQQVKDSWRVDLRDRGILRPRLAVRRLSLTLAKGGFAVDAGKQFIRWGRADIFNPTDRFAPRDYMNVIDADLIPVLAVHPSLQLGAETFEGVWTPQMTPSRLPLFNQRWAVQPSLNETVPIQDGGSTIPKGSQWGGRWSHRGSLFEMSLSYFDGFNHLPTIDLRPDLSRPALDVTRVYPELRTYGADLAIPTRWFAFKGEAAYFKSPDLTTDDYVLYVAEIERQAGEWVLDAGYAGEDVLQAREAFTFDPNRGLARSVVARASYTVDPRRTLTIEGAAHQNGKGYYVKGEFSQSAGNHWRLTFSGVGLAGHQDDFLGQYHNNSYGTIALRFSF